MIKIISITINFIRSILTTIKGRTNCIIHVTDSMNNTVLGGTL